VALVANEDMVRAGQLRETRHRIRELERRVPIGLGRKTLKVDVLQVIQQEVKNDLPFMRVSGYGVPGKGTA